LTSATAAAEDEDDGYRLTWRSTWRGFELGDGIWTGGVLGTYLYLEFGARRTGANSVGPIVFDEDARDALRAEDPETREAWGTATDIGWLAASIAPWATSVLMPVIDGFNWRVGLQLNLINLQTVSFTGFMARIGHLYVARKRPNGQNAASFPSGHAAGAFVGAALSCVHHLKVGLFGHPAADAAWCALLGGVASTTAIGRMVADKHYATDTLAGVALGVSSGIGIPIFFHYGFGDAFGTDSSWALVPATPGEDGLGVAAAGYF
jgi:membrane-associated phospholipid phosphatase